MEHEIDVSREVKNLGHNEAAALIKKAAAMALAAEGVDTPCIISVLLTDDAGIHEVNREFRGVDRPTDVLSFPQNELEPGHFDPDDCERDLDTGAVLLGDMMISLEHVAAQAREYGHSNRRELAYLVVHSVLHLLGYDHLDEGPQKALMRAHEEAILTQLGIPRS